MVVAATTSIPARAEVARKAAAVGSSTPTSGVGAASTKVVEAKAIRARVAVPTSTKTTSKTTLAS